MPLVGRAKPVREDNQEPPQNDMSLVGTADRRVRALANATAVLAIAIGATVLFGWTARLYDLTQLFTARSAMQPLTAFCAILIGGGILTAARPGPSRFFTRISAALVMLAALQTLAQHSFGVDLGIDHLLFGQAVESQPIPYLYPGRMAAPTATAFFLLGMALFASQSESRTAGRLLSTGATAVLLLSAIAFLGFLFAVAPFTGVLSFTQVALPTALALAGLSIGILALSPNRGWVGLLVGNTVGATVARWLLPATVAVPVVVGILAQRGSDVGLYPNDFRLAFTTAITVILLGMLVLWGSWQLDGLVSVRRSAEILRESEATLRAFFETEGLFASIIERRGDEVRYLAANRALSGLFGRADITGLTQRELAGEGDAFAMAEKLRAIEASGMPSVFEMPFDGDAGPRWFVATINQIADGPIAAPRFTTASYEITERKRAEAHQQTLMLELNHRVKNTLAVVQSLASQTFRGDQATPAAKLAFESRLTAVATAHSLLIRQNWEAVDLRTLVSDTAGPGCGADGARVEIEGPDVSLPAQTAVSLTLALHELCTNAVKYGALSNDVGRIAVRWSIETGEQTILRLSWTERGGPTVVAPSARGFGSRMIERALSSELRGPVKIDFRPEGVVCTIEAPISPIAADLEN